MTLVMRHDPGHDNVKGLTADIFFFFSCSRCMLPFFPEFSATSILPDKLNICLKKRPLVIGFVLLL